MKTPIIVLVMFAVYSFAGDLSTRTGHTYRNVELVSHDVFSAKIKHSAGVAVVRYAEMNDADKTLYGYDAAAENKALDARKAAEAAKKAAEEKALVEKKEREEKETKEKANRLAIQRIKEQKENEELEKVRLDAERQALAAAGKSAADMTPTELTAFKVARGAAKKELGKMQRFFARPKQASGLGSQGIGGIGGGASGPTVVTIPSLSIPDEPQGVKMTKTATGDFVFVFPVSGLGNSSITVEISDINGIMTVDSVSSK